MAAKKTNRKGAEKSQNIAQQDVNVILQCLVRRAERHRPKTLKDTFVSVGGIDHALLNRDNKIIFGRRGTGKTHALQYLTEQKTNTKDIAVYIDLRQLGSDVSLYADDRLAPEQRTARLLRDFVQTLHDRILEACTKGPDKSRAADIGDALQLLGQSVAAIDVEGEVETATLYSIRKSDSKGHGVDGSISPRSATMGARKSSKHTTEETETGHIKRKGTSKLRIRFGEVMEALQSIANDAGCQIWICIDEWTAIPEALQPYLADMLRRVIFPIPSITVQIAAIEHRSSFFISDGKGYIGIELGSDAQASVNLDDFMVFENSPKKAKEFFCELIYRHFKAECEENEKFPPPSLGEFIKLVFNNNKAVEEFVKASEGVPRDAINILSSAAQRSGSSKITVPTIRSSARDWFQQDKSNFLRDNTEADFFLRWIIDDVIGERRARAFLVQSVSKSHLLDALFDHRLVHIVKRSVASHDEPGKRYIVYKLDYGCYVELIATQRAPKGLLPVGTDDTEKFAEVPPDDYRAIRRAILDIEKFNIEQLRESLKLESLPSGPIAMAINWDVSFARIMNQFTTHRKGKEDARQLELFNAWRPKKRR
jgi:hypothetical protein